MRKTTTESINGKRDWNTDPPGNHLNRIRIWIGSHGTEMILSGANLSRTSSLVGITHWQEVEEIEDF